MFISNTADFKVIEWVEDTIPLGVYEADTRGKTRVAGAHSKYYPGEW